MIWVFLVLFLILAVAVAFIALVVAPAQQFARQTEATATAQQVAAVATASQAAAAATAQVAAVEQSYAAGLAFAQAGDWSAAADTFRQVIAQDAGYKDAQAELRQASAQVTAQAAQAQADAAATAEAAPGATAQAMAALYARGQGLINLERWAEAAAALQAVFDVDPNYQEVQSLLITVGVQMAPTPVTPKPTSVPSTPIPVRATPTPVLPTPTRNLPTAMPTPTIPEVVATQVAQKQMATAVAATLTALPTPEIALPPTPTARVIASSTSGMPPIPPGQRLHPILGNNDVRKAISYCIDRRALIASVYPFLDDESPLLMDSFLPKNHWAYVGPYVDLPLYNPEMGKLLLEEAGWRLVGDSNVRVRNGKPLSIGFTTTTAQFRQTWSTVMIRNLADCGIQVTPNYVPASWWFGETTGLARRDFELGAFAWVGQADPSGRTLYACDQIPLSSNNWEGQNYMGWCNKTASDAIIKANNIILRNDRIAAYDIVQREFARDVISIPLFQRAEVEAWRSMLVGVRPDPTEYATTNLQEWKLQGGGDTIIIGMTQEPDTMWNLVSSMAVQRLVHRPAVGTLYSEYQYDFQPVLQSVLSTLESGLAANNVVAVQAGDTVYDARLNRVELAPGIEVIDSDGNEVEFRGGSLMMNQLTVTYRLSPFVWSDGTPAIPDDMSLGVSIDCDPNSGAVSFVLCDRIGDLERDITYSSRDLAMTIRYLPGSQDPLYFLYPFSVYPSQRVISDGRVLADVPAVEWTTLPEIAERPLSYGPYSITEWNKGQSIVLERNPYYVGEVATQHVVFVIIADLNEAVAQLLNGDVDYLDDATLGTGVELQTLIEAADRSDKIQYDISSGPTWEHIDMNLLAK